MKIQKTSLILTLIMSFMLSLTLSGQDVYVHYTDEGFCRQASSSVLSSDGCVIVNENIFSSLSADLGVKFLKVSREEGAVDSLFVDGVIISAYNQLVRDPSVSDGSIYYYFTKDTEQGTLYYHAIFFTDDMDITDRIDTEVAVESDRFHLLRYSSLESGDILVCWLDSASVCNIVRLGTDGTLKNVTTVDMPQRSLIFQPFFVLQSEPLRIGLVSFNCKENNGPGGGYSSDLTTYIDVFDSELNFVEETSMRKIGVREIDPFQLFVIGLKDGGFVMMTEYSSYGRIWRSLGRFNAEMHFVKGCDIVDVSPLSAYIEPMYEDDEGYLYVMWYGKENDCPGHLRCLSPEMKVVGDKVFIWGVNFQTTLSITPMDDGSIAMVGDLSEKNENYYNSYVFVSFVDNYLSSAEQAEAEVRLCYPNPSGGMVSVVLPEGASGASVELFSLDGRLVMSEPWVTGGIDISRLATGIYIMRVATDNGVTFEEKVVRE